MKIVLKEDYELVNLTKLINWNELTTIAMTIRDSKKAVSGSKPRYRSLLGAVALMATKKITYREAEDLIAHYASARYICDLMDSDWHLDDVTIFDFTRMPKSLVSTAVATVPQISRRQKILECGMLA